MSLYRHRDMRQEEDRPRWGRVLFAFFSVVGITVLLIAWARSATTARDADLRPSGAFPEKLLGPRHEVGMVRQALFGGARLGEDLFDEQREELRRFGVVDSARGIVSIPIDDAIALVVKASPR